MRSLDACWLTALAAWIVPGADTVPDLADGAVITVDDGMFSASYRIVGRIYVEIKSDRVVDASGRASGAATLDSIIRPDHGANGAARLLLQTCDGDSYRWMIYADLITG
ncbi:MAG: hypothetical protein ABI706_11760 [Ilumatobacteraceae bacterium]